MNLSPPLFQDVGFETEYKIVDSTEFNSFLCYVDYLREAHGGGINYVRRHDKKIVAYVSNNNIHYILK